MGDIADGILEGDFDEETGEYIGPGNGYPRSLAREARERRSEVSKENIINGLGRIQKVLSDNNYIVTVMKEIDYGMQLRLSTGGIVNFYSSGKVVIQGKRDEKLNALFQNKKI